MLLAAPATAREASPPVANSEWPKTILACRNYGPLEGVGGTIEFDTLFTEDGAVFSESAKWTANVRSMPNPDSSAAATPVDTMVRVEGRPAEAWITIEWPNTNPWRKPAVGTDPASSATVKIANFGLIGQTMRKKERWHQTVIVRGSEVLVARDGDDRLLILSGMEPALISDYGMPAMNLTIPIASLLAWGGDLGTLVVYDVFIEPRKYQPNVYPNGPAGKMRIVGEYRINVVALASAFNKMRAQYIAWQKSLTDIKASCKSMKVEDPSADIIVT